MALATLSIDIVAKLASLEEGMTKASRLAEKEAARISAAFAGVNTAITAIGGALGGAFAVAGIGEFIKSNAQAIDALNDLKDATGASIENLSGLEQVALKNGGTLEQVSGILVKFNGALKEADGKNGASLAIKAIGLNIDELKRLDPAVALQQVAVALDGFADSGSKARIIQELFGKSIREAAPYLKDLAESGKLNGKVTTEQAEAAEKFNKQLYALSTNSANFARSLVSDLIPAMSKYLQQYLVFKEKGVGLFTAVGEAFKGNESLAAPQRSLDIYVEKLRQIDAEIIAIGKGKGPEFLKRDTIAQLTDQRAKVAALADSWRDLVNAGGAGGGRGSQGLAAEKPKLPDLPKGSTTKPKDNSEFASLLDRLTKRRALIEKEIELGRKLTESEQLQIEVEAQLTGAKTKLEEGEQKAIRTALAATVADAARLEQQNQLIETTKAIDKVLAEVDAKRFGKLNEANEKQTERNAQLLAEFTALGKTREEVEALALAREDEAIALKAGELALAQKAGLNEGELEAMQRQLDLLRESVAIRRQILGETNAAAQDPFTGASLAIKDYLKEVENAGEATRQAVGNAMQSLESALTGALTGKKVDARALVDEIIQEFVRLAVIKPLLANIFGGGAGGGANLVGAAAGFGELFSRFFGGFANGGTIPAGGWGIVGEAGPEVIQGPATITPFAKLPAAQGGGVTIVQYNTIGAGANFNQVAAAMQTARRQAVNDVMDYQRRGRMA